MTSHSRVGLLGTLVLALALPVWAGLLEWDADGMQPVGGGGGGWVTPLQLRQWYSPAGYSQWNNAALDDVLFQYTAGTVVTELPLNVHNITFNVSGYTLGGYAPITLGGVTPTVTVTDPTGASTSTLATISAPIFGTGGLTKAGPGILALSNNPAGVPYIPNSYAGDTTVNAGTLRVTTNNVIPDGVGKGNVNVAAGTTLEFSAAVSETINGLNGAGTVNATTATANLYVGNNNAAGAFSGVISGALNLTKIGAGTQVLTGANTYTGTTTLGATGSTQLTGGTLELSGASGRLASAAANTIGIGGTLRLSNTSAANNADRLGAGALTMYGGSLELRNDGSAANYSESVGTLALTGGGSTIRADQAPVGNTSTLTFAAVAGGLTRSAGATVNFVGTGLGDDNRNRIVFSTAPTLDDGIMGGWATVNGTDFARYPGTVTSVAALAAYNTGAEGTWVAASNVKVSSGTTTLTADRAINSLNFAQTADTTVDVVAGQTLRVETGGILVSGAYNGSITNGTLTAGTGANTAGELIVHQYSPNDFTISSTIANNGTGVVSLTTTGTGVTVLSGPQTYTGATTINGGTLRLTNPPPAAPTSPVAANLLYWLDPSNISTLWQDTAGTIPVTASGQSVARIDDLSGNGRNFTQATAANRPIYTPNALNGNAVLRFDDVDDRLSYTAAVTSPQSVFIVNRVAAYTSLDGIWGSDNPADTGIREVSATAWQHPGNANDFTNPGGSAMYINGVAGNSFGGLGTPHVLEAMRSAAIAFTTTHLGGYYAGRYLGGDIGEVLVYGTALSAAERVANENYLLAKWLGIQPGVLPSNTAVTLNAGTLDLNGVNQTIGSLAGAAGSTVALGGGTLTVGLDNTSTAFGGTITGAGNLVKVGGGALQLLAPNSFTGTTTVRGGVLAAQDPAAIPGAVVVDAGGELAIANFAFSNALTLNAGGTLSARTYIPPAATPPPGATPYTTTITGPVTIAGNATVAVRDYAATGTGAVINLMSNLTGSGSLTINGPTGGSGTLILAGNNSGYSGNYTVNNLAVLELLGTQAKGSGSVTLNSGGTVRTSVDPGAASLGPDGVTSFYYNFGSSAGNTNRFASDLLVSPARVFSRTDPNINIPWNAGTNPYGVAPGGGYPFTPMPNWSGQGINIGVLSRGIFYVATPGDYTFYAGSDDPGFLYIDGLLVASPNVNEVSTSPITLAAGWHSIVMRMTQGGAAGGMTAYYSGPDTSGDKILVGGIPGTLKTGSLTPFNLGPLTITGGTGTVDMAVDTNVSTLSLASGSTLQATSPGLYTLTVNGPTTLAGNVNINAVTGDIVFNDTIGPASAYTVTLGGGYLVTFNAPNLYTGTTTVNSGQLVLNESSVPGNAIAGNLTINAANSEGPVSNVRLLQSNQIADGSTVTMSNGILDLGANNETIATLAGTPTNWWSTKVIGTGTLTATSVTLTQGEIAAALSTAGGINRNTATAGPLILSGNNTYTGQTLVGVLAGGTASLLNIRSNNALGATGLGNDTIVYSGAQLQTQGALTSPEAITINGIGVQDVYQTAVAGSGALRNVGGNNTLAGLVTLGSASTIQSDTGNLTLANLNAATNALTLQGAGGITFSAAPSNLGAVTKSGTGAVIFGYDVGPAGSMPAASWTWNAGVLGFSGTQSLGAVTIGTTAPAAATTWRFNSDPGAGTTVTVPTGTVLQAGYAADQNLLNRIAGASAGTLALMGDDSNNLNFAALPNLSLGAAGTSLVTYSGTLTPGAAGYNLGGGGGGAGGLTVTSLLSGANALNVNGNVTLPAPNTFTGAVTLNAGVTRIFNNDQLGNPANVVTLNGGTLQLATVTSSPGGEYLQLGNVVGGGARTIVVGAGGGTIDVPALSSGYSGAAITGPNALTGSGTLTKTGLGFLFVVEPQNFSGNLVIGPNGNQVDIRGMGAMPNIASVTVNQSSYLNVDNWNRLMTRQYPSSQDNGNYANNNMFNDAATILLQGGRLMYTARNTGTTTETFGATTLGVGQSEIRNTRTGGGGSDLIITNLIRNYGGGTVTFTTPNNTIGQGGDNPRFILQAINGTPTPANPTSMFVGAWAVVGAGDFAAYYNPTAIGQAGGVGAYGAGGFPAYTALSTTVAPGGGGWATGNIGSAAGDVNLGTPGAAQNFVVGALRLAGAATRNIAFLNTTNLDTLYVESGGILSDNSNNARNIGNQTVGSRLTAGPVGLSGNYELFLHNNQNTMAIYSNIIDNPAGGMVRLVKDLDATVVLNPTVTRSSTTVSGSPNVTLASGTTGNLVVGMPVAGTGIPAGATIASITNTTQFVLNMNATSSATNTLTYYYTNTYSGGTLHERGTLEAQTAGSLGSGFVTVKNSRLNLNVAGTTSGTGTFGGFQAIDNGEIYLNNANWGVGGGNILNTINTGDRFIIEAGSTIIGPNARNANQGLNALTRVYAAPTAAGEIQLMPDAIVGHQSFSNDNLNGLGVQTIKNLGTAADLYFGLSGDSNAGVYESITIGSGTPWKGISTDRNSRSWIQGTINANSDFYLQGLLRDNGLAVLNMGGTGNNSWAIVNNAGKPINAFVVGQVTLNDDVSPSMPTDLTYVVTPGAILSPNFSNSLGNPSVYPGTGYAKVLVQAGGTLDPGNFVGIGWTANQPYNVAYPVPGPLNGGQVTIEPGGRILINDASGIGSGQAGNITMKTDSIMHLGTANAFFGMDPVTHMINPGQFVYEPGAIIRMETSNVYGMSQFISSEPNGDRVVYEIYNADRNLTNITNPFILPAPGSVLIAPENITIANGGMVTNDSNDRTLQEGRGRLILGDGAVLAGTNQTYMNIQEGMNWLPGATITIGSNRWIDGNPKLGAAQFTGPNSNVGDATNTVVVIDGAQLSLGASNTFPDAANISLPAAVTVWPPAYNPPSGYMPPNAISYQPGNGSTLLLNNNVGPTVSEVVGTLTGNGGVLANQDNSFLTVGWGASADFTFNGVFKSSAANRNAGLVKVGSTKMTLTGQSDSLADLYVLGGELALAGAGAVNFTNVRVAETGTLTLDNSVNALNNRLSYGGTLRNIAGQGGVLNLIGNNTTPVTETIGTLYTGGSPTGGLSYLNVTPGTADTTFVATTIESYTAGGRQSTWVLRSPTLGNLPGTYDAANNYTNNIGNLTNGLIRATTPNLWGSGGIVGSGMGIAGSAGTPVASTRPDLLGTTNPTGQGVGFVTQDVSNQATVGFRLLTAAEYAPAFLDNMNSNLNIRLTGTAATSGDTRFQTLTMTPGSTLNITGTLPYNLTPSRVHLNSPGIFVEAGGTATINGSGTWLQALGSSSLYLHTQGDLNLNAIAFSDTGIVKTGPGTLAFGPGAASAWRGTFTIDDGTVTLGPNNSFYVVRGQNNFSGYNLSVNGGTLDLGGNSQIVSALNSANWLPYGAAAGGTITSAAPATFAVQGGGTFSGGFAGAVSLDKLSNNTLTLTGNNPTTGPLLVRQGTLVLRDEALFANTPQVDINYGTLQLENGYLAAYNNRINPAATVNMRGGTLDLRGGPGAYSQESLAVVNLLGGQNTVNINAGGSGVGEIVVGNLVRSPGTFLSLTTGYGFIGTPGTDTTADRLVPTNINGLPTANTNGILGGWAIVGGDHFATYLPGQGLGALSNTTDGFANYDSGDVTQALAWQNVNDGTSRTIPVSRTVNSIRNAPNAANTWTLSSGVTLTVASGGILTNNNNVFTYTGGTLTSGTNELDVWVNQNNTVFSSVIADGPAGSVSLVKGGGGTLTLQANNTYTGTTYVDGGTLTLNRTGANGTTDVAVPGNLVIHNATVSESLPSQIRATADVTLYAGAVLNMRDAVVTETLNSLTLINNGGGTTNNVPIVSRANQQATAALNLTAPVAITAISDNVTSTPSISQNLGIVNFARVGAQTIDVQGSSPLGLVFNAAIGTVPTGVSEGGLVKTGPGVLHLGGNLASTFGSPGVLTDVFNIQQGIVRVDTTGAAAASSRLGSNFANTVVQSGAGIVARASNANPIFGSIRLKAGSFLGVSEGDSTFGAATTSIPSQSLLNVAGDATIYVADYWLQQTHGYTINLNSKLTGSGNINLIGPQITSAVGTLRLGNNITDDPAVGGITPGANDYSGTITINTNAVLLAQATASAVTGNQLGTATINLAGGTLALRDNNSVNYGNNVILSANSFMNANNAGANTGNTITLGTLTVPSGAPALTTTFTAGDNINTVNNNYQITFASIDGAGTLVKGGHQIININGYAGTFSGNLEVAGPQGIAVQPSANLRLNAATNNINNLNINGIFSPTAGTTLNVANTLRVGDNAGQVINGTYGFANGAITGAMSVPSTATVTANILDNSGIIGSTGGNATLTATTLRGTGLYQTWGQPLTLVGSLADGSSPTILKVAGNNVVTLQPSGPGTSTGGTEVQSGTFRLAPTAAVTNPLGTGDVEVLAYAPPTVTAATSATLQLNAAAGAIVQNSNVVNSGLVQVTAGSVTIGGTISGPGAGAYVPGLLESLGGTWNATTPQGTANFGIKSEPRMGNMNVVTQDPITGWGNNHTWVYSGQFYDADGYFSFIENIDDNAYILIDGVPRLSSAGSVIASTAMIAGQRDNTITASHNTVGGTLNFGMGPNGDGWHTIEIRFNNGGGGAGPWAAIGPNGFANNFGFGLNTDGTRALDGALYTRPIDPGDASLFRTPIVAKGNVQVDAGATLNANAITLTNELRLAAGAPGGSFGLTSATPSNVDNLTVTGSSGSANLAAVAGAPLTINTALTIPSGTTLNAGVPADLIVAGNTTGAGTLNLNNTNVTFPGTTTQSSSVNIAGTGNLIKNGPDVLNLAGSNTYAGATLINDGTLRLGALLPAGAALWLDASDLASITRDGSGRVSQWNDKSGNNRNATQGTTAAQPISIVNPLAKGQSVMRFDGTDDMMNVDLSFLAPNSRYTMFIVEGRLSNKSNNYLLGTAPEATNQGLHVGYRSDTQWTLAQYGNDLNSGAIPGYTTQLFRLWTNELDNTGHYIFLDGVQNASNTNTTGLTTATFGKIGAGGAGTGRWFQGDITEAILYATGLSATDRLAVETYLRAKWFGNPIPDTSPVIIALNALLDLNSISETIGSLGGAGNVALGSGTLTTGGNNQTTIFDGILYGTGGLVKEGTGAFTMNGASSYTGPTTVNNGSLYIDGSIASNVMANGGRIGGSGVINGAVNVGNARIGAGTNASTAILTMGDLTMTTNSVLEVAIGGLLAGTDYDQLSVQGLVNLAGAIDLGLFFLPGKNDFFFIIVNDGADPVNGIFNGLPQDSKFAFGSGIEFQLTYVGDYATNSWYGGNDVALRLVPEPGTLILLALGAGGALLRRRAKVRAR